MGDFHSCYCLWPTHGLYFHVLKDLSFESILGRCDNIQVETLVCSFPCSPTTTRRQMLGDSTSFSSQQTWSRLRTQLRAARGAAFAPTHTAQTMPPPRRWRAPPVVHCARPACGGGAGERL